MAENPRIEELRRRVQADPASIAFAALAEEFRRVGRFEDAIETCRTGLQRHPAYLSARVTLGRALIEVGEYDGAREELETVLRSAPENLAATRGLAQIHERLGHSTEMHPDLHEIAREPIRLAALNPPPSTAPPSPTAAEGPVEQPSSFPPPHAAEDMSAPPPADALSAFDFTAAPEPSRSGALEGFDLSLPAPDVEPPAAETSVDIFTAALKASESAEPPPAPTLAFETGTIAFESPAFAPSSQTVPGDSPAFAPPSPDASADASADSAAFAEAAPNTTADRAAFAEAPPEGTAGDSDAQADAPDAHVAAALTRLERFLDAIQSARHA